MPKEDRSHWVAVAPESTAATGTTKIAPAKSAYQFYQREITPEAKTELIQREGSFDVGKFSRLIRDKWNHLNEEERHPYEEMARDDAARFARESHAADIAAMERRERLQRERQELLLETGTNSNKRSTRGRVKKMERKREKKEKRAQQKKRIKATADGSEDEDGGGGDDDNSGRDDDEDDDDGDGDGDDGSGDDSDSYQQEDSSSSDSDSYDSDASNRPKKKAKKKSPPRPARKVSQKQVDYRERVKQEKKEKEEYITSRQEDLRKEKSVQAKRRLEFLLKQSNIFSHFGQVKEDQAKYGIKPTAKKSEGGGGGGGSRRDAADNDKEGDDDLGEAEDNPTTYLTSQPTTLGFGQMRQYQLEGLNWMIGLQENGVNGILADEMGLGKTLQSISILVYMMEYRNCNGPHLIVVPKSTLSNWLAELGRWAPTLTPVKFHGDKATREDIAANVLCPGQRDENRTWHVCVTTYEVCNIEKNVLNKFAWSYLIIDEAHRLKNEASAFAKTVRAFETRYRILLTGTPLQNSLHELWALLNFLVPDVFANAEQFDEWFNLDIEDNDEKNRLISQLHKILRPFMLRRLKKEVEKSLPPKHETILFTGMSAMQKKLYRDILIRDIDALQGTSGSRTAILNIVMQLRKCAGHPYLFPGLEDRSLPPLGEHLVENCGKMVLLDKLLKRLRERGHRVLLFTQMTRVLDIMEDYLVMRRFPYCRIDGNTSYEVREDYIEAFNAPNSEKFLFLLSTRAGGLGINLQTADVVILYDSDWNPQADLQAQDRAHRIGQKREVQVFRFVTEHTIEEKIVERAQQKLKLDAMVVQQGRLKEKDKLSRDELLEAVRFGADKIFKSKDSSITDEDIDLIMDAGKRKTQELNEKLMAADKGDLLDFKLDGSSNLQTFEGVDYSSNAFAAAKAEAELMGIIDMGKRERRTVANYNENKLYRQQMAAIQGGAVKERTKKKIVQLPKDLRMPRMEEWQMFQRNRLLEIQEVEEVAFRALPEEVQKRAIKKPEPVGAAATSTTAAEDGTTENDTDAAKPETAESLELPPLLDDETQAEKERLLAEGFIDWTRADYSAFIKASARHGRDNIAKIAVEVGKSESSVQKYANAFWGDVGKQRFSEHEYDRVIKLIEKGEKKIGELRGLERGARILISLFDNPWEELEFCHVNIKDKLFTIDNDRYLLCWAHKFGYGQWHAVKMAVRRSPKFRFDYFLRSLPTELMGRRCEQLMRAAEKEVELLEKKAREVAGLPQVDEETGKPPPVQLPPFRVIQKQMRLAKKDEAERLKRERINKVHELEKSVKEIQDRLKELNRDGIVSATPPPPADEHKENRTRNSFTSTGSRRRSSDIVEEPQPETAAPATAPPEESNNDNDDDNNDDNNGDEDLGAIGPDGEFIEFPEYDCAEPPKECKKAFTHFCNHNRRDVKASLDPSERKNKAVVNDMLRDRWMELTDDDKKVWRGWAAWDKKRFARDVALYEKHKSKNNGKSENPKRESQAAAAAAAPAEDHKAMDTMKEIHIPKKRKESTESASPFTSIPKKKKRR